MALAENKDIPYRYCGRVSWLICYFSAELWILSIPIYLILQTKIQILVDISQGANSWSWVLACHLLLYGYWGDKLSIARLILCYPSTWQYQFSLYFFFFHIDLMISNASFPMISTYRLLQSAQKQWGFNNKWNQHHVCICGLKSVGKCCFWTRPLLQINAEGRNQKQWIWHLAGL